MDRPDNAHEQMRRLWRSLPPPEEGGAVFDAGHSHPTRQTPSIAMTAFEPAFTYAQDGWPAIPAAYGADLLAEGRRSVVTVHGLTTPHRAFITADGSTLIGRVEQDSIRIYPGFLHLRHKLRGARVSIRMGEPGLATSAHGHLRLDISPVDTDGPGSRGTRAPRPSLVRAGAPRGEGTHLLLPSHLTGQEPHPHLDAHRWVGHLRAAVDRFAALFDSLQGDPLPPAPGAGWDGHAYPRFLPHPTLTDAAIDARKATLLEGCLWLEACFAQQGHAVHRTLIQMEGGTMRAVVHADPRPTGSGLPKHTRQAYMPPDRWPQAFPEGIAQALAAIGHEDSGVRYVADNNAWKATPWHLPYAEARANTLTAHQRLAYTARWGIPSAAQAALAVALFP